MDNKSRFLSLYRMALIDGSLAQAELDVLYRLGEKYEVSQDEITACLLSPGEDKIPTSLASKVRSLYDLAQIAWADGVIEPAEKDLFRSYVLRYGFLEENVDAITETLFERVKEGRTIEAVLTELSAD